MTTSLKTPAGRLKESGAREIIRLRMEIIPMTYQQIAHLMGVSVGTVYNVVKGRTWPWLGGANRDVV